MKKALMITTILIVSLIIGILAILTAMKLTSQQSVSPNAPEIKPKAQEVTPTPPPSACTVTFRLNPTPTPTSGPSPTPTVTSAPTSTQNIPPTCTGLSASPNSGDAPLLVTFVGSGFDDNAGYLSGFEFTFGDGDSKKIEQTFKTTDSYTITHSYAKAGTYVASVRVKDNNGDWSSNSDTCKQTITVTTAGIVGTPTPTTVTVISPTNPPPIGAPAVSTPSATTAVAVPKIPTAGNLIPTIFTIVGGAVLLLAGWAAL